MIRLLNFQCVLGNDGNATDCRHLLGAIQSSRFRDLSYSFYVRGMLRSMSPGRTDRSADYRFYNPFVARIITADEALVFLRGMDWHLPSGHPKGWEFLELSNHFVRSNGDLVQLRTKLNGWVKAEDEPGDDKDLIEVTGPSSNQEVNLAEDGTNNKTSDDERLQVVGRYLCDICGVPENVIERSYEALVTYIQGGLHCDRHEKCCGCYSFKLFSSFRYLVVLLPFFVVSVFWGSCRVGLVNCQYPNRVGVCRLMSWVTGGLQPVIFRHPSRCFM